MQEIDSTVELEYVTPPVKLLDYSSCIELIDQIFSNRHLKNSFTALLFIEFDDLSQFNNAFGFDNDEQLMIKIDQKLDSLLKREDILARAGKYQYIIMQDLFSAESAEMLAKRIIHMLSEPCVMDENMFYIYASIGISLYPVNGDNAYELIKTAENTMKQVQKDGKNRIGFTKQNVVSSSCEKSVCIMRDLPTAIEKGEIYFMYQPQYSHAEERFKGAEILARWKHPKYGEISPELFIPLAEQSGMIDPLTVRTIVTASKAFALFELEGINDFSLSVNISPAFLMTHSFSKTIDFLIKQYDLTGKNLSFEITEEVLIKNTDNLMKTLQKLKELDISIELDDFGTGYTSLQHLARLPIDTLKVDKSFVSELDKDTKKRALFKAIVDMSHALGIDVIAEGVENSSEDNVIKTFESITVQGYFYSKPISINTLIEKLKSFS